MRQHCMRSAVGEAPEKVKRPVLHFGNVRHDSEPLGFDRDLTERVFSERKAFRGIVAVSISGSASAIHTWRLASNFPPEITQPRPNCSWASRHVGAVHRRD